MTEKPKESYPAIFLSSTDAGLPDWFSNDFKKYSGFQDIAGGGGGALKSCNDANLGRKVAIKTLLPGTENVIRDRRRLLREARITAQLAHPNTVPVYEIGKTDEGEIYFSMKKVEGEDLYKIMVGIARGSEREKTEFTLDRFLSILIQACNALSYAHTRGVIHRDIKPENILVGLFGEVYLMDWGVAKVWGMPNETREDEVTSKELRDREGETNSRPGTPLYMSPEQVRDQPVDERSDIFSMGVVLYEVLALREPFRGRSIRETFENVLIEEPPPPSTLSKHFKVPPALDAICAKAMQKKPSNRYQSMREMVADIRRFRDEAISGE